MLALCETPRCRRQTLLAAFGEKGVPCGFCDLCDGTHPRFNGVVAAQKAMSALIRTSGRFFPGHLANLLIGKTTEAITRHGHDALPTFGVGTEFGAPEWRSIFRQIQAAGLIAQDDDDGGRWHVTDEGRKVLSGAMPLELLSGDTPVKGRRTRDVLRSIDGDGSMRGTAYSSSAGDDEMTSAEASLFAALKAKRLDLARERKVPAYVVLSDRSLRDIARARPRDADDLTRIHGIGPTKVETYGAVILDVVASHAERF